MIRRLDALKCDGNEFLSTVIPHPILDEPLHFSLRHINSFSIADRQCCPPNLLDYKMRKWIKTKLGCISLDTLNESGNQQ